MKKNDKTETKSISKTEPKMKEKIFRLPDSGQGGIIMRKLYLDNIRWATVLLVMAYHVCYLFNGVGILGGIPGAANIPAFDTFAGIVYPWFMVLLFIVAGISARFSLQKRTGRQFLKERARKLLLPSTLGLFFVHWITGYLNIKMGGGLSYIPSALVYPISVLSGIGPLWFIQTLFLFSCLLILLTRLDKKDKLWTLCGKAGLPAILPLFLLLFGASRILNMPVLTMYRFGIYFVSFLIGYYLFSHDEVQQKLEKVCIPMLFAAVVCAVFYAMRYDGRDFTAPECLESLFTNLYLWLAVLAVLGCAGKYFNQKTPFTDYLTKSSFGFYILHYPVLLGICYLLHFYGHFPAVWNYIIAFPLEIAGTFAAYEIIRRIPLVRYFVLGIRKKA